ATRNDLMDARVSARRAAAESGRLDFLPETREVRESDWQVAPAPAKLRDRRVEITGPAAPANMAIHALNSAAKVCLADLEGAAAVAATPPAAGRLSDTYIEIDGQPATAAVVGVGLPFLHDAATLHERGEGPF